MWLFVCLLLKIHILPSLFLTFHLRKKQGMCNSFLRRCKPKLVSNIFAFLIHAVHFQWNVCNCCNDPSFYLFSVISPIIWFSSILFYIVSGKSVTLPNLSWEHLSDLHKVLCPLLQTQYCLCLYILDNSFCLFTTADIYIPYKLLMFWAMKFLTEVTTGVS